MIGQTISHYKILEKLGEGGMGVVYRARDTKLDRDVALKFLPERLAGSPDELARFEMEARSVSALNHPGIATIHDVESTEGQKFLVLEYLPGGTLRSHLKELGSRDRELPVGELLDYGIQMAEALAHAHENHIVHRDVKSDNVMLAGEGRVKLTDFGLAKLRGAAQLTKSGSTLGTAAYMSPEQIRGEDVDGRADIFSLGVVLYEMATMRMPFRGEHDAALAYSIVNEEPAPVRTLRPALPDGFDAIVAKCLAKDRAERYQSARDVASALKAVRAEISGSVKTVVKHSKLPYAAAVVVAVVAVVAFFLFRTPPGPVNEKMHTIAVLPFANLGGEGENEYFSDGMTEDILTHLAKIRDLKVISRTSVMQYKNTKKTIRQIGEELNAGVVLEGSVRRAGDQVRITAQLIDAATDEHLWAESYDKKYAQIFEIQSDVAQKIAAALEATLSPAEKARIETAPTSSTEGYTLYLKGRYLWNKRSPLTMPSALRNFQDAVAIDSNYALAWTGIADCYLVAFGVYLDVPPAEAVDRSEEAIRRALAIDPDLAEAYSSLGALLTGEFKWEESENAFKKAIELNPGYATARQWYAELLFLTGRFDESIAQTRKAIELDPISPIINANLGWCYLAAKAGRKALTQSDKILEAEPGFLDALDCKVQAMVLMKVPEQDLFPLLIMRDSAFLPLGAPACGRLRDAFASGGLKSYWRVRLDILDENSKAGTLWWEGAYAENYAQLGDADKAFQYLTRLIGEKNPLLTYFRVWGFYESLRGDPRYDKLVSMMNLSKIQYPNPESLP